MLLKPIYYFIIKYSIRIQVKRKRYDLQRWRTRLESFWERQHIYTLRRWWQKDTLSYVCKIQKDLKQTYHLLYGSKPVCLSMMVPLETKLHWCILAQGRMLFKMAHIGPLFRPPPIKIIIEACRVFNGGP